MPDTQPLPSDPAAVPAPPKVGDIRNSGEPIRLANLERLVGFAAEVPAPGSTVVRTVTRHALVSDDPDFHSIMDGLSKYLDGALSQAGKSIHWHRVSTVLFVRHEDGSAEIWADSAAQVVQVRTKKDLAIGRAVFYDDIVDMTRVRFPLVELQKTDQVICLVREGWRFALVLDMNLPGDLNVDDFERALGSAMRDMRYRKLYDSVRNGPLFERLLTAGWFPFAEIIRGEYLHLAGLADAGHDLSGAEAQLIDAFTDERVRNMLSRWVVHPACLGKVTFFSEAVDAFLQKRPVTVIKILSSEIEGVLNEAHRISRAGAGAQGRALAGFAEKAMEEKLGGQDTLLLAGPFARYLKENIYAGYSPSDGQGSETSKYAVTHGSASPESYTMVRALQLILALDHLVFSL